MPPLWIRTLNFSLKDKNLQSKSFCLKNSFIDFITIIYIYTSVGISFQWTERDFYLRQLLIYWSKSCVMWCSRRRSDPLHCLSIRARWILMHTPDWFQLRLLRIWRRTYGVCFDLNLIFGFYGIWLPFLVWVDVSIFDVIWDLIYSPRGNIIGTMIFMNEIVVKISTA